MGEVRGEKLSFRRKDILALHQLPSAQAEDPLIVHCPARSGFGRRCLRLATIFSLFIILVVSGLVMAIESGAFDRALSASARNALSAALGSEYSAEIQDTALRFSNGLDLAVEAHGVVIRQMPEGEVMARADRLRLVIEPLSLLSGKIMIDEIISDGVDIDADRLPAGPAMDLAKLRVDSVPQLMDRAFRQIDTASDFISRGGLDKVVIDDLAILHGKSETPGAEIAVDHLTLQRALRGGLKIDGEVSIAGKPTTLSIQSERNKGHTGRLQAKLEGFDLGPVLLRYSSEGEIRQGLDGQVEISIAALRAGDQVAPSLSAAISGSDLLFYMDGNSQKVTTTQIALGYDFSKDTIEVRKSRAVFGRTVVPFSGGLIDLDRFNPSYARGSGIAIDLLAKDAVASIPASGEPSVPFDFKLLGRYLYAKSELQFDQLTVATPVGNMAGSLHVGFVDGKSPEISFSGQIAQMQTSAVKQLWPFWMADKPREWVMENLIGGTVRQGSISVFIPAGRMTIEPSPLQLHGNELSIAFDVVDTRVNIPGDIPPVRDAAARVEVHGGKVSVAFKSGASYFRSGRKVELSGGTLTVSDAYQKPLMADIALDLAGKADAVAELVTYKPIDALKRTGLTPADLTGDVTARLALKVGLVPDQNPPPPEWTANLALKDVSLAKPYANRKIESFDGTLKIDPQSARIDGKADIDGIAMDLALVEPVSDASVTTRERVIKAQLSDDARDKLAPGLDAIVKGTVGLTMTQKGDSDQSIQLDLRQARMTLPWVGWSKGQGVAAKATFNVREADGVTHIEDFRLLGDGFGAHGALSLNKNGLIAADVENVKLSAGDDYSVSVRHSGRTYSVKVGGAQADARALIASLKTPGDSEGPSSDAVASKDKLSLDLSLDRVIGFAGESLRNVKLTYGSLGDRVNAFDLQAISSSSQAVVAKMGRVQQRRRIDLTTSDAGALVRFANLYTHMDSGLLNLRLTGDGNGGWNGAVDVRNFSVNNEQRLQTIVSTPADADGRSLNAAVKRDIDVSSERFQRAYARLAINQSAIRVDGGVVRGEQVGATFQGLVRDETGAMDMTGTFMPAYGLNRILGELPIIGTLLGNGRDRGLLGITFRLTGAIAHPKVTVNPLSIIAPGVFRQIFEFR
ncbi:DUF3971 domain-containing protein [Rhizobium halophytocola]|uniref:YhdP central domain-containing protein n=1 Tax=Rhizobium halophytocola TaxID=735519 RepID=A0ABS4DZF2_9HYPH|nr:DUF3971 domain-containing protein [Rhizobium halophytocola]MBP1851063.1 hypothetical protein [Rhizobium halophytocola]